MQGTFHSVGVTLRLVPDLEIGYKIAKSRGTKVELISSVKTSTSFA